MRKIRYIIAVTAVIMALSAAGCGSDSKTTLEPVTTNPAETTAQTTTAAPETSAQEVGSPDLVLPDLTEPMYSVEFEGEPEFCYDGEEICPEVAVYDREGNLISADEYKVSYRDNICAGTAYADVVLSSGDLISREFEILPMALDSEFTEIDVPEYELDYTGSDIIQPLTVIDACANVLTEDTDYTVTYENAAGPGLVTATVTGIGNYSSSVTATYVIRPQAVSGIKQTKSAERSVTLSWNASKGAQGYQVCLKNSGGYFVMVDINTGVTSAEIGSLEPATTYTFYIRPYLNADGVTYYAENVEGFRAATTKGAPGKVIITEASSANSTVTLKWSAVKGAEKYVIEQNGGSGWESAGMTTACSFNACNVQADKEYKFRVRAESTYNGNTLPGEFSEERTVTVVEGTPDVKEPVITELTAPKAYYFSSSEYVYDTSGNRVGTIAAGATYCAYCDPDHQNMLVVDYMYGRYLVSSAHATERPNSVILETAAVGQMGGSIWGQASCGPTAVAILADWEKGAGWNKDDLIRYSEQNYLNDQGSLRAGGGMTAPKLLKLISGYSGGTLSASNIYGSGDNTQVLKNLIDSGKRAIIVCQYTSYVVTHYSSGTHFIVICGYETIDGVLYFYYADPYYAAGGRSLLRVAASTLSASMSMVAREPRCIVVMN